MYVYVDTVQKLSVLRVYVVYNNSAKTELPNCNYNRPLGLSTSKYITINYANILSRTVNENWLNRIILKSVWCTGVKTGVDTQGELPFPSYSWLRLNKIHFKAIFAGIVRENPLNCIKTTIFTTYELIDYF